MLPAGNTNHGLVWKWVWDQSPYLDLRELHLLDYLCQSAFVQTINGEGAPVGQVMKSRSSIAGIVATTRLSRTLVFENLASLQAKAYVWRTPRRDVGHPGRQPRILRIDWTGDEDQIRARVREGEQPPLVYRWDPNQAEAYEREDNTKRRARLQIVLGDDI